MKRKWWIVALAALALLAAILPKEESRGICYRVTGGKSEMTILGSIHAGSRDMYPMHRDIRQALKQADLLVFECDTESAAATAATQALMFYPAGETLADHIRPECLAQVEKAAAKLGYDMTLLNQMKPWALVSLFSVENMADTTGGTSKQATELGVEKQVQKLAGGKPRAYLETAEMQLTLMDNFTPELQQYLLQDACEAVLNPAENSEVAQWPTWWREGNAKAFAESYQQEMNAEPNPTLAQEYHNALITTRNANMANELAKLLEGDQSTFVTIGLMHLVLENDSVLTHLQEKGYTIAPLLRP